MNRKLSKRIYFFIGKRQYTDQNEEDRRQLKVYEREANGEQARGQKTYQTTLTKKNKKNSKRIYISFIGNWG